MADEVIRNLDRPKRVENLGYKMYEICQSRHCQVTPSAQRRMASGRSKRLKVEYIEKTEGLDDNRMTTHSRCMLLDIEDL